MGPDATSGSSHRRHQPGMKATRGAGNSRVNSPPTRSERRQRVATLRPVCKLGSESPNSSGELGGRAARAFLRAKRAGGLIWRLFQSNRLQSHHDLKRCVNDQIPFFKGGLKAHLQGFIQPLHGQDGVIGCHQAGFDDGRQLCDLEGEFLDLEVEFLFMFASHVRTTWGLLATDEPVLLGAGQRVEQIPAFCARFASHVLEQLFDLGKRWRSPFGSTEMQLEHCLLRRVLTLHVCPSHLGRCST
jgi:hypothetical protein